MGRTHGRTHGWKLQRGIYSGNSLFRELARLLRRSPRRTDHTNKSTTRHAAFGSGAVRLLLPNSGTLSQSRRYRPQSTSSTTFQSSQPQCLSPAPPQCASPACGTSGPRGAPHIRLYFSSRPRLQNIATHLSLSSLYTAIIVPTLICRYPHRTVACRPSRLAIACQAQQQKPSFGSIAAAALAATSLLAGVRTMGLPEAGRGENGSTTHLIRPACEFPFTSDRLCQSPLLSVTAIHSPPPPAVCPSSELQRAARADVPAGEQQGYRGGFPLIDLAKA